MSKKGKRGLTSEDKAIWERVARSATPLKHPARRVSSPQTILTPRPSEPVHAPSGDRLSDFRIGEKANTLAHPHPQSDTRPKHAPVRMDHGAYKKMTRGKLKPEGRIDLHGMTMAQAHPALTRFVLDAHASGKRLVLVITGKGKDRDHGDPIPVRRGILRHQVPNWLHIPPLGALVLDVTEAHQRHGGGGAYYVYLTRRG